MVGEVRKKAYGQENVSVPVWCWGEEGCARVPEQGEEPRPQAEVPAQPLQGGAGGGGATGPHPSS